MTDSLADEIMFSGGYQRVRVLEDGSIAALGKLLYTTAIHLGCNRWGHENRFCFDDHKLAVAEYEKLTSENDVPTGFIARR